MRHHIGGPLDCHQRRLVFRALVAGSLLSAAAWVPVGQWANAAGNIASAAPKTYTVQPASQKDSPVLQNLGATFTISVVPAQTEYISSVLVIGSPSLATAVTQYVACRPAGSAHTINGGWARSETGQNILPGTTSLTLTARFEFVAPDAGRFDCALDAIFVSQSVPATSSGTIKVLSGSYIQDAKGPLAAHAQAEGGEALVTSRTDTDIISSYTVPSVDPSNGAPITSIDVVGDVEVTNCYEAQKYHSCPTRTTQSLIDSDLNSQLVVNQLNTGGSVCVSWTDPLLPSSVSYQVHHKKIYHRKDSIPVSSSCTSRAFTVYVRTWYTGGNVFEIEADAESNSFLFNA